MVVYGLIVFRIVEIDCDIVKICKTIRAYPVGPKD